jgi:YD repeat-containing protein
MEYDKVGKLVKTTNPSGKVTAYSYESNGNLIKLGYPDGSQVSYTYNPNNQMTSVVDAELQTTQFVYDAVGNTLQIKQPSSSTSYSYNKNGLPIQVNYTLKDETTRKDVMTYDVFGNILSTEKTGSNAELSSIANYSYDKLGRLTSYSEGNISEEYRYDNLGNMTEKKVNGEKVGIYQYNEASQLTAKILHDTPYTYQYDQRGNLIGESRNGRPILSYTYDATNHMVLGKNLESGESSAYKYNGLNMRVQTIQTLKEPSRGGGNATTSSGAFKLTLPEPPRACLKIK